LCSQRLLVTGYGRWGPANRIRCGDPGTNASGTMAIQGCKNAPLLRMVEKRKQLPLNSMVAISIPHGRALGPRYQLMSLLFESNPMRTFLDLPRFAFQSLRHPVESFSDDRPRRHPRHERGEKSSGRLTFIIASREDLRVRASRPLLNAASPC